MDGHAPSPFPSATGPDFPLPTFIPDHPNFAHLERLEGEITELWGHINAATYRFLELVAEFDEKQGWGRHGCASCAHWLNWQCGIGTVAAREKVRVARALAQVPQVSAAFARGELSYSKVRAVTRVATPENEEALLNIALHGTASHVERVVSRYRRVERLEAAYLAEKQHRGRYVHTRYDDDGALILQARLPAEVGAVVLAALEAAETALMEDCLKEDSSASAGMDTVSAESPEELSRRQGPLAETCAEEAEDRYAARRADALRHLAERFLDQASETSGTSNRYQVVVHVDQTLLSSAEDDSAESFSSSRPRCCELESGRPLAAETVRRLGCDTSLVGMVEREGEPLSVGRKTRSIPPALRRALQARDGGCRFPGCARSRHTEGHHVRHWADGGETALSNLVTLCRFHHRLIHEGGFGVAATDDGLFVFSRPDGSRLGTAGRFRGNISPDGQRPLVLETLNRARGLEIDAGTARSRWRGEVMDYGFAIEGLWNLRPQRE